MGPAAGARAAEVETVKVSGFQNGRLESRDCAEQPFEGQTTCGGMDFRIR
jgi:hypothetical protein